MIDGIECRTQMEEKYGKEAADYIRDNVYVDDGAGGGEDVEATIQLTKDTRELCKEFGFNLTKYISSSKEVVQSIPPENRADGLKDMNLGNNFKLPAGHTLGLHYNHEEDCFEFYIDIKEGETTRQVILGSTCTVFDPQG